jgi:hypothetical protein
MRIAFAAFLALHALVHLMGFAKAFGLAELPQLTQPVSRAAGVAWLAAAGLLLAAAVALFAWPQGFWAVGAAALVLSQALILGAWRDARFGTIASAVVLAGVLHGFLSRGPWSFRASFEREAAAGLARRASGGIVTEADLAPLPAPVQRYLRLTGAVGAERVRAMRARFRGWLRGGPAEPWMPLVADQVSFFDRPTRLVHIEATRSGVPFEALHRLVAPRATFAVKVASLVTVTDARGPEMDRSEAVTFLNDMAILAPAALLSPAIRWEAVDDRTARAAFTLGEQTVRAELRFDGDGRLVGFQSDDRMMASRDGRSFRAARWSTPVRDYRSFGAHLLASRAEAVWELPEGPFVYARFETLGVDLDP